MLNNRRIHPWLAYWKKKEVIVLEPQQFFRIFFIAIFTVLVIIRLYFQITMEDTRNVLFNLREKFLLIFVRFLLSVPLTVGVLDYVFFSRYISWSYIMVPFSLRFTGLILGGVSLYILFLSHRELGKSFSSRLIIKKGHRLVRTGPYRMVRHPMYSSFLSLFVAAFLISENWVIGISGASIILTLITMRISKEEALLIEYFKDEYEEYRQFTGMFFPLYHQLSFHKKPEEERISP